MLNLISLGALILNDFLWVNCHNLTTQHNVCSVWDHNKNDKIMSQLLTQGKIKIMVNIKIISHKKVNY